MHDPFAHLETVDEIQEAERKARKAHPILWWVAEAIVFVRGPTAWVREWRARRRIGYDARPRRRDGSCG